MRRGVVIALAACGEPVTSPKNEAPVELELATTGGAVRLEVVPVGCDVALGASMRSPVVLEAGDAQTAELAGCTWMATFLDPGTEPLDMKLHLTAK